MKANKTQLAAALILLVSRPAFGADGQWTSLIAPQQSRTISLQYPQYPGLAVKFTPATIFASYGFTFFVNGQQHSGGGNLNFSISDFARQSDLQTLQSQVGSGFQDVNTELQGIDADIQNMRSEIQQMDRSSLRASAESASLVAMTPSNGDTNRLGFNTAMVGGESALGVSYVHTAGHVDFNAGVAFSPASSGQPLVRAGFGVSW